MGRESGREGGGRKGGGGGRREGGSRGKKRGRKGFTTRLESHVYDALVDVEYLRSIIKLYSVVQATGCHMHSHHQPWSVK